MPMYFASMLEVPCWRSAHWAGPLRVGWVGQHAYDEKIGRSGLWNTQQLDAEPLNEEQVDDLKRFV